MTHLGKSHPAVTEAERAEAIRWFRGRLAWEDLLDRLREEPALRAVQTKRPLPAIAQIPASTTAA